ncbi:MAG: hypothetical protein FD138_2685 [Planctomycetota bacterium]|nr:MAG: hypothetical protein FD138_2685 [Planctomycetota bacterium]
MTFQPSLDAAHLRRGNGHGPADVVDDMQRHGQDLLVRFFGLFHVHLGIQQAGLSLSTGESCVAVLGAKGVVQTETKLRILGVEIIDPQFFLGIRIVSLKDLISEVHDVVHDR